MTQAHKAGTELKTLEAVQHTIAACARLQSLALDRKDSVREMLMRSEQTLAKSRLKLVMWRDSRWKPHAPACPRAAADQALDILRNPSCRRPPDAVQAVPAAVG